MEKLIEKSVNNNESATILTAYKNNPFAYGRIIRDERKKVKAIVEQKDAIEYENKIKEINSGIYCFDIKELLKALKEVRNDNAQGEYYLTDVIKIMNDKGLKIGAILIEDNDEILGVNDRVQFELLTTILKINIFHMKNGVTIEDIDNTYIYDDVEIGKDTVIHPNTIIINGVKIVKNCELGPNICIKHEHIINVGTCIEEKC